MNSRRISRLLGTLGFLLGVSVGPGAPRAQPASPEAPEAPDAAAQQPQDTVAPLLEPEPAPGDVAPRPAPPATRPLPPPPPAPAGTAATPRVAEPSPPPVPGPGPAEPALTGHDRAFYFETPDGRFRFAPSGRLQFLYTLQCTEDGPDRCLERFSLPRARLGMAGWAFSRQLGYTFQGDFGAGVAALRDYYLDGAVLPGRLVVRLGQFKRPFSRQEMTSDASLEAITLSPANTFSATGRDIGLMLHDAIEKSPALEWAVGVFNGRGVTPALSGQVELPDDGQGQGRIVNGSFSNVPRRFAPAFVARIGYNHGGLKGYSEADLEGGPLRVGVGLAGLLELDADGNDQAASRAELDAMVKVHGLAATAGLFANATRPGSALSDFDATGNGAFAQASYTHRRRYSLQGRYTLVSPDQEQSSSEELLLGLAVYFFGHDLKWQTQLQQLSTEARGQELAIERGLLSQLQLAF